jgi:HTH-type transcriptional regulator, sugar sensing transcriptional regulator
MTIKHMQHLIESLQNLGLTEKEAKVYLALLQLGPATPYRIAVKAGIKRPTAYVIAEELVEKGIIVHVPGEEPKRYIARAPESVIESEEARLSSARRILPELKSLQKGTAEKPSVLYFEGTEGMRQALMYRAKDLHDTEIVGFYADPDFSTKETQAQSVEFNEYRIAHNIRLRGLLTEAESLRGYEKYILDKTFVPKFIPKEMYSSNASFEFCPDFIKILFFDASIGVVIESPTVAKAMRQIFEMLWSRLGDEYTKSKIIK